MTTLAGRGLAPNHGARRTNRHNATGLNGTAAPGPIPLPTTMIAEYAFDPTTDFPDIITEISPTTDPLAMPTWSRLHDTHRGVNRLLALTTDTGRQRETDVYQPGTAGHQLDNHDRILDPKYVAGALDTFSRADSSTTLGDAEFGGTWVPLTGVWGVTVGTALLVSGTTGIAVLPLAADGTVQVTLPTIQDGAGVAFRVRDSANYWAVQDVAGFGVYNVYKVIAGAATFMGNFGGGVSGDVLKVVLSGSSIGVYLNTALAFSVIDATYATETDHGLLSGNAAGAARWNDFSFVASGASGPTASPYAGHLDPGNRIRDRVVWGSRTYELYTGFAQGYQQRLRPPASAQVDVQAVDLLDIINGNDTPTSPYAAEVSTEPGLRAWWRLGESSGLVAADSSPNGYDGDLRYSPTLGQTALLDGDATTSMTFPGAAIIVMPSDAAPSGTQWTIETVMSHGAIATYFQAMVQILVPSSYEVDLYMDPTGVIFANVDDFAGHGSFFSSPLAYTDSLPHLVRLTQDGTRLTLFVDGSPVASGVMTFGFHRPTGSFANVRVGNAVGTIKPWDGLLQDVSFYDQALGADNAARHWSAFHSAWSGDTTGARAHRIANLVGIGQWERAIDSGLTTMGAANLSGSDLGYLQLIEATEQGQTYIDHDNGAQLRVADRYRRILETFSTVPQAVFTDDPASTTGYRYEPDDLVVTRDKQLIFNDITVTWAGGSVRTQDATSRRRFGRRARTITTDLPTADQARALGRWFLAHYKDPIDRILQVTLKPSADKRLFDPLLGLKQGHLVTFEMQPQGIGTRSSQNVIVEGKHLQLSTGVNECTGVLYVSNADVRSYFRPGVSSPDGTDGPAF